MIGADGKCRVCGLYCSEMDIMEANTAAFQVTPHGCDPPEQGYYPTCDHAGCGLNTHRMNSSWYGAGPSYLINTLKTFQVSTSFEYDETQLVRIRTELSQGENVVAMTNDDSHCPAKASLSRLSDDLASGMTLVISSWGDSGSSMSWLDVPPCSESQACPKDLISVVSQLKVH